MEVEDNDEDYNEDDNKTEDNKLQNPGNQLHKRDTFSLCDAL
jgi:hypothetical protein